MKKNVTTKQFTSVVKSIRENRESLNSIIIEFLAYWGKVFPLEAKETYADVCARIKAGEDVLKSARYQLEIASAKRKALDLTDEAKAVIKQVKMDCGLGFKSINMDYISRALAGTKYINADGLLVEFKLNKETNEREARPVEKWTISKFGRYLRLAYQYETARVEVVKVMNETK